MKPRSFRFRLLGPLEVHADGKPVRISAAKQRTVLAMLLVHAGRTVTLPTLAAEVWDGHPPPSAMSNLRLYVTQLRRLVRPPITSRSGYLLRVDEDDLDLLRFQSECARARSTAASGDLVTAEQAFGDALSLWRGRAIEDVAAGPKLRVVAEQLTEQHLAAAEGWADVQLALGRHAAVVRGLRALAEQYPLRERVHRLLMLALYRSGDVVGALDVFTGARGVLAERLGLAPGPELVRRQQEILRRDPGLELTTPSGPPIRVRQPSSRLRQLTKPPSSLIGRAAELATLKNAVRTPGTVLVHGLGGTGKSALALRAAHAVANHFPDGQLYADLQGASPHLEPLAPAEVLRRFLRALGVPNDDLPADLAGARSLCHSLLAGRRILTVLDNAADAAQVTPLLAAGQTTLVTSRSAMPALDAGSIALDVLGPADSQSLLGFTAGQERLAAEPDAAADIGRWCDGHPLALRIAGARLAARPDWSLARLRERLRDPGRRLDELQVDDLSIRSCLAVSYRLLSPAAATAFQLVGTLDEPEIDALGELVTAGLLTPVTGGRFRMHGLVRLYAAELAAPRTNPGR